MAPGELAESLVMIGIVVACWPIVFWGWGPAYYKYPLYAISFIALAIIFVRRLRRTREGLEESERMTDAARQAQSKDKRPLDR